MFLIYRNNFRGAVALALGPTLRLAGDARWTSSTIPTLENALVLLDDRLRHACPHRRLALQDDTVASPLDTADGHYKTIIARLAVATPATITAMSQAFATIIAPLGTAPATRVKAARNWRSCVTWALARGALHQLLPMPTDVLLAMLWDFTAMGASKSTLRVKAVVDAVIARHRAGQLPSPISGNMAYSRLAALPRPAPRDPAPA
jgi:hypothetical protein